MSPAQFVVGNGCGLFGFVVAPLPVWTSPDDDVKHGVSRRSRAEIAFGRAASPGGRPAVEPELGLHRDDAGPVPLVDPDVARVLQGVGVRVRRAGVGLPGLA